MAQRGKSRTLVCRAPIETFMLRTKSHDYSKARHTALNPFFHTSFVRKTAERLRVAPQHANGPSGAGSCSYITFGFVIWSHHTAIHDNSYLAVNLHNFKNRKSPVIVNLSFDIRRQYRQDVFRAGPPSTEHPPQYHQGTKAQKNNQRK